MSVKTLFRKTRSLFSGAAAGGVESRMGALGRRAWAETVPHESPLATPSTPDLASTCPQERALCSRPLIRSQWSVLSLKHVCLPCESQDVALGLPGSDFKDLLLGSFYEAPHLIPSP